VIRFRHHAVRLFIVRRVAVGLGAHVAALVGVSAEVPHEILAWVGDVLGELGDDYSILC